MAARQQDLFYAALTSLGHAGSVLVSSKSQLEKYIKRDLVMAKKAREHPAFPWCHCQVTKPRMGVIVSSASVTE
jgi:hypothetical protein